MQTKHYGTLGLTDQHLLSTGYDAIADHMWMEPEFYAWIARQVQGARVPRTARVLDVGCGTGPMLAAMAATGFQELSGVDFSARCVELTQARVPHAQVWQQDVLAGTFPPQDAILMTEVLEHVRDPVAALRNIRASLAAGGRLFLSFPNRWAYWPLYYLNPLRELLPRAWLRGRSAFDFLTTPYEMRSTQPIDHAYSVPEVRRFIGQAGLRVLDENGLVLWPMLRVSYRAWPVALLNTLEATFGRLWPRRACYRYLFICEADQRLNL